MKKENKLIIYLAILFIIFLAVIFFFLRAEFYYHSFVEHKKYLKENPQLTIQDWMTPHTVERHFNITQEEFSNETGIKSSIKDLRTPIKDLCIQYKLNCPVILDKLNNKLNGI